MELSLFERFLFEAPGDDVPPDQGMAPDQAPEDLPDAPQEPQDDPPPDIPDDEPPPDINDGGPTDDFSGNEPDDDTGPPDLDDADSDNDQQIGLDDKVSAIMNANLYQRFLTLLNSIQTQQHMLKNNLDVVYAVSPESIKLVKSLSDLDENIRIYLTDSFHIENYSKNLLFFNKCLNLLKLLNDAFNKQIAHGIKQAPNK